MTKLDCVEMRLFVCPASGICVLSSERDHEERRQLKETAGGKQLEENSYQLSIRTSTRKG